MSLYGQPLLLFHFAITLQNKVKRVKEGGSLQFHFVYKMDVLAMLKATLYMLWSNMGGPSSILLMLIKIARHTH
jgi:hypothetical protein